MVESEAGSFSNPKKLLQIVFGISPIVLLGLLGFLISQQQLNIVFNFGFLENASGVQMVLILQGCLALLISKPLGNLTIKSAQQQNVADMGKVLFTATIMRCAINEFAAVAGFILGFLQIGAEDSVNLMLPVTFCIASSYLTFTMKVDMPQVGRQVISPS